MHGLRQNLRIPTPGRHALFLLSNRLCRHQHESFKGKKKISRWWRRPIFPPSTPAKKLIVIKRRKNFRCPERVSRILPRPGEVRWPRAGGEASGGRSSRAPGLPRTGVAARPAERGTGRSAPPAQPRRAQSGAGGGIGPGLR